MPAGQVDKRVSIGTRLQMTAFRVQLRVGGAGTGPSELANFTDLHAPNAARLRRVMGDLSYLSSC
jgi:hypothetical protein